jgi:hypothetical protein
MNVTLSNPFRSIVLIANTFNPSILRESWLIENDIIAKDDFLEDTVFSSNGVQVVSSKFVLTATDTHLQLMLKESGGVLEVNNVLLKLVGLLKHVNYIAVGFNFDWELRPINDSNLNLARLLFYSEQAPVYSLLNQEDAYFGGYVSCNFLRGRMKLDMKPRVLFIDNEKKQDEFIHFNFNYHHDINSKSNEVIEIIGLWEQYVKDSNDRVDSVVSKLSL